MIKAVLLGAMIAIAGWGEGQDEFPRFIGVCFAPYDALEPRGSFFPKNIPVRYHAVEPSVRAPVENIVAMFAIKDFPPNRHWLVGASAYIETNKRFLLIDLGVSARLGRCDAYTETQSICRGLPAVPRVGGKFRLVTHRSQLDPLYEDVGAQLSLTATSGIAVPSASGAERSPNEENGDAAGTQPKAGDYENSKSPFGHIPLGGQVGLSALMFVGGFYYVAYAVRRNDKLRTGAFLGYALLGLGSIFGAVTLCAYTVFGL